MKINIIKITFLSMLSSILWAQEAPPYSEATNNTNDESSILQQIENDIFNLGASLGFMIGGDHADTSKVSSSLTNEAQTIKDEFTVVQYLFATLSVNNNYIENFPFIANPIYDNINKLANQVFNNNENPNNKKLDSEPQIKSPVAQYLQNILSVTPDSYCFIARADNCNNQDWDNGCKYNYTQSKIFANSWGIFQNYDDLLKSQGQAASGACTIDATSRLNSLASLATNSISSIFFPQSSADGSKNYNSLLLNQLDSSLLVTPLLYENNSQSNTTSNVTNGLATSSPEEAAENYIKYVTGSVLPPDPMSKEDLDEITKNISNSSDIAAQLKSFRDLSKYVLGLRVYASRVSVAVQNIYEILGSRKKLPNDNQDDPSQASSQALNEFKMASYRLYNPKADINNLNNNSGEGAVPWQQMINDASPARVQKETAILLAEINYQLYLMRKQQEKILLTNSVMLLQSATAPALDVPDADEKTD